MSTAGSESTRLSMGGRIFFLRSWAILLMIFSCQFAFGDDDTTTEENTVKSLSMTYMTSSSDGSTDNAGFGYAMVNMGPLNAGDDDGRSLSIDDVLISVPFYGNNNEGELVILFLKTTGYWTDYSIITAADLGMGDGATVRWLLQWALAAV
jgi:hypothetical protein